MSSSFEIKGKLHKKFDTENKTETFQAREFVILVESGNYPQYIKFQLTQDRCSIVDSVEQGEEINVHFDLRGREWNEKYFTNLNAWRIEKSTQAAATPPPPAEEGDNAFPSATDEPAAEPEDDLPF